MNRHIIQQPINTNNSTSGENKKQTWRELRRSQRITPAYETKLYVHNGPSKIIAQVQNISATGILLSTFSEKRDKIMNPTIVFDFWLEAKVKETKKEEIKGTIVRKEEINEWEGCLLAINFARTLSDDILSRMHERNKEIEVTTKLKEIYLNWCTPTIEGILKLKRLIVSNDFAVIDISELKTNPKMIFYLLMVAKKQWMLIQWADDNLLRNLTLFSEKTE
jgi:hypothetical protein